MANNYQITRTATPEAQQLANIIANLWSLNGQLAQTLAVMQQAAQPGSGSPTWTAIETLYGLPSGSGQAVYGLVFAAANGSGASGGNFAPGGSSASGIQSSAIWALMQQLV